MRPMPHQATRAFSAKLADVLGRVFQGVEPSVPQVRNTTRMSPSLTSNLYSNLRSIFATDAPTPTVSCTSTLRTWPRVAARIGRSSCPTASPPTKLCTLTRSASTEASPSLSGIITVRQFCTCRWRRPLSRVGRRRRRRETRHRPLRRGLQEVHFITVWCCNGFG